MKIYHCKNARSFRPLWTLEELGEPYELEVLPFPPRALHKEYLVINPLGTVPCLIDGDLQMTESAGICQYLVDRHGDTPLKVTPDEHDYGAYLNWLHRSDATLTFPQTIFLRYSMLEPEERRIPQAANDYKKWFLARFKCVEDALADRDYLCADRFTIADICVAYAILLANNIGIKEVMNGKVEAYWKRLEERPAFARALAKT